MSKQNSKLKLPLRKIVSNNFFMLRLITRHSKTIILWTTVLHVFGALSDFLFYTLLLKYIVNSVTNGGNFKDLAIMVLISFAAQIIYFFANSIYYGKYYELQQNNVQHGLYKTVFEKSVSVDLDCFENPAYYDKVVKALNECANRVSSVISSVNSLFYRIVNFSANFALLYAIDPALFIFALIPLIGIPMSAKINKWGVARTNETNEVNRYRDYSKRAFYLSDYAKELRLTNMPALLIKTFKAAGDENYKLLLKYGTRIGVFNYIITLLNEVISGLGATIYAAYKTLVAHTISYGDCVIVFNSVASISYSLTDSARIFLKFQENALFIENLRTFLNIEAKIKSGTAPLPKKGDLTLENVSFKYEGATDYAVKNVSLKIGKNEKVAIVGQNGSGKTTLVKLLLRLYDAEGQISYGGTDIKDLSVNEYRGMFSAVMQDFHIFALTTAENVLLRKYDKEDKKIVTSSLKKAGLLEKINSFVNKENTILTKEFDLDGELLSGGEQQKLSIAHVYSKDSNFVILDEPSSALDPIAEHQMYEKMYEACENCGMIFISHRLSSAVTADKIYLMDKGEIVESGTHKELITKNGLYAEMFRRQAENYTEVE